MFVLQIPGHLLQIPGDIHRNSYCYMVNVVVALRRSATDSGFDMTAEKEQRLTVHKSNDLVEASYSLTVSEQRIILAAIGRINGYDPASEKSMRTRVTAREYAARYNLSENSAYEALKSAADRLYERDIRRIEGKVRERFRWVSSVRYDDGEGAIELGWSIDIMPYLTLLERRYTIYDLEQISRLESAYSIRIYEMLTRWKGTGEWYITLDEFRHRLDLTNKYSRFANLRARVIQPSVDAINRYTDLDVDWEPIRKGRKVVRLMYLVAENKQSSFNLAAGQS